MPVARWGWVWRSDRSEGGASAAGGSGHGSAVGRCYDRAVMETRRKERVRRRGLWTGRHDRSVRVHLDARLDGLLEKTAEEFGYAKGLIARDAVEQGIWRTQADLEAMAKGKAGGQKE